MENYENCLIGYHFAEGKAIKDTTYYIITEEAYKNWRDHGVSVQYTTWLGTNMFTLRHTSKKFKAVRFDTLSEEIRERLRSTSLGLFNIFDKLYVKKEMNKFEQIKPEDYYIGQWTPTTYYLVNKVDVDSTFATVNARSWYDSSKVITMSKSGFIRFNRWNDLTITMFSGLNNTNSELYEYFEQYYENSQVKVVKVFIGTEEYTHYRYKGKDYPAIRVPSSFFEGELIPQEVRIFHSQYVKELALVQTGSDFDIDKVVATYKGRTVNQQMYDIFKGPLDASDYIRLKDPYGQEWPLQGRTIPKGVGILEQVTNYSPNINQINNENLRTTHQCNSGRKELSGNPIQSKRIQSTIATGHFSNREGISSSTTQAGISKIGVSV